jgi:hypothetical protein
MVRSYRVPDVSTKVLEALVQLVADRDASDQFPVHLGRQKGFWHPTGRKPKASGTIIERFDVRRPRLIWVPTQQEGEVLSGQLLVRGAGG